MPRHVVTGLRLMQLVLVATALSACKSGGGGGGGGSSAPPAGSFTLSASSLTFSAKFTGTPATPQSVLVTLSDTSSATLGAGFAPGVVPPSWLTITTSGSGLQYSFAFFANTTTLAPGTYTTTVTIGTADASGTILQTRDVQVTYIIRDGVRITSSPPVLTGVSGSSQSSQTFQVNVEAPAGLQWAPSSSQPWLQPQGGTRSGAFTLTVTADTSTLPPGQATATLTVTNVGDSSDTATLLVTADMSAPILTTTLSQITLGGETGLEIAPVSLGFALGTGTNAYPWTLTATTTSGGSWLTVSSAAGTVAASNVAVNVDADRTQLAAGTYTGELELRATLPGVIVTRTIPVTLKLEANRLLVSDLGVAFSSFPSRQVLTRTLAVRDTRGETGVPWQATASEAWLQATLTGDTGDPLVLTANPTGLAAGQYLATVTVVSSSTPVVNTETIRVGLTVGTTDPQPIDLPLVVRFYAAENPVEPEVFVTDTVNIEAYNVYTGASRTVPWTGTAGGLRNLAMSADGASLYVIDDRATGDRIVELDPVSGTERRSFALSADVGFAAQGIAYARPDAHPVLLTTYYGDIFDVATGALFTARINTPLFDDHAIDVSSDQRYVYTLNSSLGPSTIYRYEVRYSSLAAGGLVTARRGERSGALETPSRGNGYDIAVSSLDTIYVAAASPYQFDTVAPDTLERTGFLPATYFPNNVETCWNGLVAGGTENGPSGVDDIWVYGAASTPPQLDSGTGSLIRRTLKFSGDCTRLVSASGAGLRIQAAPPAP